MSMTVSEVPSTQTIMGRHSRPSASLFSAKSFVALWRAFTVQSDDELDAKDAASTLFRFFRSRHVMDLKLIFGLTLIVLFVHVFVLIGVALFVLRNLHALTSALTYLGPAIPVYGAVMAWAYLTAGKRLGVVDLFACEIATVCRVGTIFNTAHNYVQRWKKLNVTGVVDAASSHSKTFVSQEDYFPIFAANSHDLQALEALTVSHITEFYTYMKATRDSLRRFAEIDNTDAAKEVMTNIIYTLFLGYESARKAICELIEFQPTATENIIVILLTELECYPFLCDHFRGDELRFKRLQLRETDYLDCVPGLINEVQKPRGKNGKYWEPSRRMLPELTARYERALEAVRRCAVPPVPEGIEKAVA